MCGQDHRTGQNFLLVTTYITRDLQQFTLDGSLHNLPTYTAIVLNPVQKTNECRTWIPTLGHFNKTPTIFRHVHLLSLFHVGRDEYALHGHERNEGFAFQSIEIPREIAARLQQRMSTPLTIVRVEGELVCNDLNTADENTAGTRENSVVFVSFFRSCFRLFALFFSHGL